MKWNVVLACGSGLSLPILLMLSCRPALRSAEIIAAPAVEPAGAAALRSDENLVQNPSFEHNWFNRAFALNRRFLLLQASDLGVGEADGHIDHWRFEGIAIPESWDTSVAHSGSRSVRFTKAGRGTQLIRFAGETHWLDGGSQYNYFLPLARNLAAQVAQRPIVVGAWCKSRGVPAGGEPELTLSLECGDRAGYENSPSIDTRHVEASVSFAAGTHDWEYREIRLDPAQITGTPFFATVGVVSPGKGGTVWFDDISCQEPLASDQPNRIANAGFEALDRTGWAQGWQHPVPWTWFRQTYYSFTGWSHGHAERIRGGAAIDRWISYNGHCSLRFTVFPGDNFAVASRPITLRQGRPRPIEVRAMVKADNLRTLEIMAMDENGEWLPQGDFLGADMEEPGAYNMGTTGSGSYDWLCVRKYFSPRKPVQSLRLFLCARGFDGAIIEKNCIGTVWFDDIQLNEHGVPPDKIPADSIPHQPPAATAVYPFQVREINLGDRLWGRNQLRITLGLDNPEAVQWARAARLRVRLTDPTGRSREFAGQTTVVRAPTSDHSPGYAVATAPYEVSRLCSSWQEQYRLSVRIDLPGAQPPAPAEEFAFGTPSQLITPGITSYYPYPDEPLLVYANLNVARDSFPSLSRCDLVAASDSKERTLLRLTDFARLLQPATAPDYINTERLIAVKLGSEGFAVQPWNEPVRDNRVTVRLYGKTGTHDSLLAESAPIRFGFLHRFPRPDFPETIQRTAVNERGYLSINGKPYFPVYWTPHFGICPEADYPARLFGYRSLDLTDLVYSEHHKPDEALKAKLLARVNEVKNDPRFFQYELGEGEMALQDSGWVERLGWLRQAIAWIRAADPNHIINGPESWLVGHPDHDRVMQAFVPDWDAIGVETSFEQTPRINLLARPLMKKRRSAVLVGLETYFYQPDEVLRWRGYRSVLDGAAGIGLCPSGMLQARPDKVSYLRGLNGEFRGLAPVISAAAPADRLIVSPPLVDTMERELGGRRYIIAVRNRDQVGALLVRFRFPTHQPYSHVRVMFEGRSIRPTAEGYADRFDQPQTVHVYVLDR